MPALIGPVQIFNVEGGTVHFGDTAVISPKAASKTTTGSGSNSSGAFIAVLNGISTNGTLDTNLIDQPTFGNN
ncbi:spore germination protein [Lederbergia galactosidilytica]|uniref:Spore gernimation protein GerPF n=1 Tax=Lederbergia galactosidilytica TaxID=217031 RepID=A0A0Q9YI22_9BACI|nr:spore germination protein [Lederbergia galactosidilytica]KRG16665.1 spore gernimation protein GerPF [Virgibacillus soli]KRG16708.1 spore gernimation protein GerPF [Lederbergia galactosidilytica]MBP1915699.1 spore germination protein PF [Lederbergia galactosidilytica]OAK67750.1 spore gernimation protein GerPF [Lederbergia galactosidilytica]